MGRALIALLAALLAAPLAQGETVWAGRATDNRGDQFEIVLREHDDGSASLAYDGAFRNGPYHCEAVLLADGRRSGVRLYREAIVFGGCIHGAVVTLARQGERLRLTWTGDEAGAPVTYEATLARR